MKKKIKIRPHVFYKAARIIERQPLNNHGYAMTACTALRTAGRTKEEQKFFTNYFMPSYKTRGDEWFDFGDVQTRNTIRSLILRSCGKVARLHNKRAN